MKTSWKALLIAPAVIPLLASAAFVLLSPGQQNRPAGFLILFAIGCAVSYGATLCLLLPALYLLSRFTTLTTVPVCLTGAALGWVVWLPAAWVSYCASGVNSGPPSITFFEFLLQQPTVMELALFAAAGGITAFLYQVISRPGRA